MRLVALAADHWSEIDGDTALRGVDLFALPPRRFFNALYAYLLARVEEPKEFRDGLWSEGGRPSTASKEEMSDFAAFMAATTAL